MSIDAAGNRLASSRVLPVQTGGDAMRSAFCSLAPAAVIVVIGVQLAAAQGQAASQPGPEHQRLGYFVEKWKAEGEIKPGPMGPGGKITSTDNCEWFEGHYS